MLFDIRILDDYRYKEEKEKETKKEIDEKTDHVCMTA